MTEPVSVPARQRSPGHTLRPAAAAAALCPRGCRLGTPSSDMSLSGHLCLLTIVGLILPSRGQILKEATSISPADLTSVNANALTPPVPDTVHREPQSTPRMGLQTSGITWEQMEGTQTPQPPEASELLAADGAMATTMTTGKSSLRATPSPEPTKGTTLSKRQSPGRDIRRDPPVGPTGSSEDDPFSYDEDTLRKRGLLVAAVLFITGIVILTSGKCRRLPQLCRNYNRIVSKAQPGREDPDGARAGADDPRPLCSPPCPP